jgi:hypothetical protein
LDDNSRSPRTITASNAVVPVYVVGSRSEVDEPSIYVVNYDDEQGFAVISGTDIENPILGVAESGSYDENADNPGLKLFVEIAANITAPSDSLVPLLKAIETKIYTEKEIEPRLSVKWGQGSPYGNKCPNGISGCANTASAQIMSYFRFPSSIDITYTDADTTSVTLDWDAICKHVVTTNSITCLTGHSDAHDMIAYLMRELGYLSGSQYNANSTGTQVGGQYATLKKLGYTLSSHSAYTEDCEFTALANGIMLVDGYCSEGGHSWVIDGCKRLQFHVINRLELNSLGEPTETRNTYNYAHVNWGWDGRGNGYYLTNVFDTSLPYSLDDSSLIIENNYNFNNGVYFVTVSH